MCIWAFAVWFLHSFCCKSECIKLLVHLHVSSKVTITLAVDNWHLRYYVIMLSLLWGHTACGMSSDAHMLVMKHCLFFQRLADQYFVLMRHVGPRGSVMVTGQLLVTCEQSQGPKLSSHALFGWDAPCPMNILYKDYQLKMSLLQRAWSKWHFLLM